jgi:hypothetical protein
MGGRLRHAPPAWLVFYAFAVVLLLPRLAHAWGPATHIDFGLQVLRASAILTPFVRELLRRYPDDYLYGCCAADIVVGKNFAKYLYHCHNWQVGLRVLDAAYEDRQKALCYGFLTHLAADTVAHNFFVPYKTVEAYDAKIAKHTYWEVRFDEVKIARNEGVWTTLKRIGQTRFPEHDAFLEEMLVGASRLFSFGTSKTIFNSMMLLTRLGSWRNMMSSVAARSDLALTREEFEEFDRLAMNAIFAFLIDVEGSRTVRIDPTGARSIRVATDLRRELRALAEERKVDVRQREVASGVLRARFREGIHGLRGRTRWRSCPSDATTGSAG